MSKILDGKKISAKIRDDLAAEVIQLNEQGIQVTLAVIVVGQDPASRVYVNNKKRACAQIGYVSKEYVLLEDITESNLLKLIQELNADRQVNGILVQLPLPKHINEKNILKEINPVKDVDAFHAVNVGNIMIGDFDFLPCTPAGVMELLKAYDIEIEGKYSVVVGRSNIVGKPMAMLLLHQNSTVTICHSKTNDLTGICQRADIIVAAIGKAKFIKADMIKDGAVIIDVGMNRDENGRLCGDVDFEDVKNKVSAITPVPGGVGPMTIAMLMKNTLNAAKLQNGLKI